MGASGGGPHALACAALLADWVTAAVCMAGLAPFSEGVDWFAGMRSDGALRAAAAGREARARFAETAEFDPETFIDDDVAFVTPRGYDLGAIGAPVLIVHGGADRMVPSTHADWLVRDLPRAELWLRPDVAHASGVLRGFVARYAR